MRITKVMRITGVDAGHAWGGLYREAVDAGRGRTPGVQLRCS